LATFKPFCGVRYSEKVVGEIERVVAPPYDVISSEEREAFARKHPYNVVQLILPKAEGQTDKYETAGSIWREWLASGALRRDERPAFYICDQEFIFEGAEHRRRAVTGRVLLEEFGRGSIYPHEHTMSGPKADRMRLMQSCRANLSPVFGLFPDPGRSVLDDLDEMLRRSSRSAEFTDWAGIRNTLWVIDDPEMTDAISAAMNERILLIADGHHRYETALEYRNTFRPKDAAPGSVAADYVMMACVSMRDQGLKIVPTHRGVKVPPRFNWDGFISSICADFRVSPASNNPDEFLKAVTKGTDIHTIGLYAGPSRGYFLLSMKNPDAMAKAAPDKPQPWRELDVAILQKLIMENRLELDTAALTSGGNVMYSQVPSEIFRMVNDGECELGFILNPTLVEQVRSVAEAGSKMPPKSTFFYPKLLTGMAFHYLAD